MNDEVRVALDDVKRLAGLKYPTGTDRAFLCHAAVVLASEVTRLQAVEEAARNLDACYDIPGITGQDCRTTSRVAAQKKLRAVLASLPAPKMEQP